MSSLWKWLNSPAGDAQLFDITFYVWVGAIGFFLYGLPLLRQLYSRGFNEETARAVGWRRSE